ncbi:hypothetical protein GCT13_46025 [Paraburkholderia sp. CNPSo 3157]|uniref:Uncharacterized protein n=1 Tax=Paraburkholderia franconis TaxID=2654983 RepID=A0A7X1TLP9_9BURK|nr:hypothetical protein [Paraburkholderia franconis]
MSDRRFLLLEPILATPAVEKNGVTVAIRSSLLSSLFSRAARRNRATEEWGCGSLAYSEIPRSACARSSFRFLGGQSAIDSYPLSVCSDIASSFYVKLKT